MTEKMSPAFWRIVATFNARSIVVVCVSLRNQIRIQRYRTKFEPGHCARGGPAVRRSVSGNGASNSRRVAMIRNRHSISTIATVAGVAFWVGLESEASVNQGRDTPPTHPLALPVGLAPRSLYRAC